MEADGGASEQTKRTGETVGVKWRIERPPEGDSVKVGPTTVQGLEWGGESKIAKVEVSMDEGKTWEPARLVGEDQPYAWRQWQYIWQAAGSGRRTILCRATDDHGQKQTKTSPRNPSGYPGNGGDGVTVSVAA